MDSRGIQHLYRPGDIQIDGIDFPKMLVDITVVSPFCTNAPAVFTVGQAAQQAEDKKMETYFVDCRAAQYDLAFRCRYFWYFR